MEDLIARIRRSMEADPIGGEPMARGAAELAQWCRSAGLSVLVFTGFLQEELLAMDDPSVSSLPADTDIPAPLPAPDTQRDWIGSQKVRFLSDRRHRAAVRQPPDGDPDLRPEIPGWPF